MVALKFKDPGSGNWIVLPTAGPSGTTDVVELTQAAYDALGTPDPNTFYVITDGADRTVLTGTAAPTAGDGINGDFWINTTTWTISGPKAAGAWPTAVSIVGPQGLQGIPGTPGVAGLDAEGVLDTVAAALIEGAGIDITYNDAANTITLASFGGGGGGGGTKLTDLTTQTAANSVGVDLIEVVDVDDTTMALSGTNKKITLSEYRTWMLTGIPALITFNDGSPRGRIGVIDADEFAFNAYASNGVTKLINLWAGPDDVAGLTMGLFTEGSGAIVLHSNDIAGPTLSMNYNAAVGGDLRFILTAGEASTAPHMEMLDPTGATTVIIDASEDAPAISLNGTSAQYLLNGQPVNAEFTETTKGVVPPPVTATGAYLKDDGTWDTPAGGGGGGPGTKLTELAALTGAAAATTDLVEVVDISDTSMAATGTNKKMVLAELVNFLNVNGVGIDTGTVTAAVDWNTLDSPGTYNTVMVTDTASQHAPTAAGLHTGVLVVDVGADVNEVVQSWTDTADTVFYVRAYSSTAEEWGSWASPGQALPNSVSNQLLVDMPANTVKGNNTGSAADPKDLSVVEMKNMLAITSGDTGAVPTSRTITTTAPLTIGGASQAQDLSTNRTLAIAADGVTNTFLATMPTLTVKGNNTGSTAGPQDLTAAQLKTMLGLTDQAVLSIPGNVAVVTGALRYYFNKSVTVTNVRMAVGTAPTGASLIADLNKNGTTIFTTQGNRPTIAVSTNTDATSVPDITSFTAGDYMTVDIDQVGSTVAGANLTMQVEFTYA